MQTKINQYRLDLEECFDELDYEKLKKIVIHLMHLGTTIYIIGNGGSASTASHMETDLAKTTSLDGYPKIKAVSLTNNTSLITALANDLSYETVFVEQLKGFLKHGDIVIGLSVSGNSPNILAAMKYAREKGAVTIGFIGFGGGKLKDLVDIDITVSSCNYGVVEDFHLSLNHILSQFIKEFREEGEKWKL